MGKTNDELIADAAVALDKAIAVLNAGQVVSAMAYLIREGDLQWGFFSDEEDRMHLQTVNDGSPNYKFFLERDGKRVFEPASTAVFNPAPKKRAKALETELKRLRSMVEKKWTNRLIKTGKIKVSIIGHEAIIDVYPGTRNAIRRTVDLRNHATPSEYEPGKWALDHNASALALNTDKDPSDWVHIYLPDVIWS